MFTVRTAALTIAALAIGFGACQRTTETSKTFSAESQRLQGRTAPLGARVVALGAPRQELLTAVQEWSIATPMTWAEYVAAVNSALEPPYQCTPVSNHGEQCSYSRSGDTFLVELVAEPAANGLVVQVRFEARPD
jgi:hypothetical protein